jgi:multidrug efflux pump subunit AcrB
LSATDAIYKIIEQAKKNRFPRDLNISITDDQSEKTRSQLSDLENSIISGMLLVIMVLYFFLGLRNALFVGFAIPMSMFVSFLVFGMLGYTLNMVVLFSLILALGMLVDNAIVVIENMYRLYEQGYSAYRAAKEGVGEIAIAIISSTATTLAAFVPLLFWKDLMGEFMRFIPLTLIIVLSSSLFVALVLNPVIASVFIRKQEASFKKNLKEILKKSGLFVILGLVLLILGQQLNNILIKGLAGLSFVTALLIILDAVLFRSIAHIFNTRLLPYLESAYLRLMDLVLKRGRPGWVIFGTFALLIVSIVTLFVTAPKVEFFPVNMPSNINVFIEAPTGSDIFYTDSISKEIEKDVYSFVGPYQSAISSIITNVGKGTNDPKDGPSQGASPNKARIKISFKEFKKRGDVNTADVMKLLSAYLPKYPGIKIKVDKNRDGPPRGKPVSIEVSGDDFAVLMDLSSDIRGWIDRAEIPGIEGLETDLDAAKPELLINVDRDKAKRFGISTSQIGSNLRTALFGKEVSKFKDGEEDYSIMLRLKEDYRTDLSALLNQKVTFRNKMNGKIVQVPASSVMDFEYDMSFGSVNRKDMQRVVTISSNVIEGYNANLINSEIEEVLSVYSLPEGYSIQFTGEQKEQVKAIRFLSRALMIAIAMIWLILLSQFNSFLKPIIIVITVLFSTIGVFMGLAFTGMDVVVILTGIGVVSLAGIVVNNAIVLIDYIDLVKSRRKETDGIDDEVILPRDKLVEVIKEGGKTRLRPVLLTAITTVLGLIPLAIGLNIDFTSLITSFDPKIYFGGDNTIFWSPLAWTIIYGLLFATFLTLVVVPTLYLISERVRLLIRPFYIKNRD